MSRRRFFGFGGVAGAAFLTACQLIAGIDEKTSSVVANDAGPVVSDASDAPVAECTKHSDCITKRGANWVCVKPENKCQTLLTADCPRVLVATKSSSLAAKQAVLGNDETIFFGLIMDLRGPGKNAGLARQNAVELALSEIHSTAQGIPGGTNGQRRPIAVVACSETTDERSGADAKVPAAHLIDDLHVPAILGAANSESTIDLVSNVAVPKGTLVFSTNALALSLSAATDSGLFWRTSQPATAQGRAIRDQIAAVEAELLAGGATAPLKLAVVYVGDAFGRDIRQAALEDLQWNGAALGAGVNGPTCATGSCDPASRVYVREYAPNAAALAGVAQELATFGPHVVVALGRRDSLQIVDLLEGKNPAVLPRYILTQGAETQDVNELLVDNPTEPPPPIRARIRGTRPLGNVLTPAFSDLYDPAYPEGPRRGNGVQSAYDVTYLLTYAALAAPGEGALTGARMNEGLKRVLDPTSTNLVQVGSTGLVGGLDLVSQGRTLNVRGYSYTANFDVTTGEAPGKVDVWCLDGALNIRPSGTTFDPAADGGTSTGAYNCP